MSYQLQAEQGKSEHLEEQGSVGPTVDVGIAIGPLAVANRNIDNLQIQLAGAKQKIEVAEWIEVAENMSVAGNMKIVFTEQDLRSTKSVFDRLSHYPGKREAEKLVGAHVQEAHRFCFHWIDQAHAI